MIPLTIGVSWIPSRPRSSPKPRISVRTAFAASSVTPFDPTR